VGFVGLAQDGDSACKFGNEPLGPIKDLFYKQLEKYILTYLLFGIRVHLPVCRIFFDLVSSSFVSSPNKRSCITDFDFLICRLKDKTKT
jgi:hypothetical protein